MVSKALSSISLLLLLLFSIEMFKGWEGQRGGRKKMGSVKKKYYPVCNLMFLTVLGLPDDQGMD